MLTFLMLIVAALAFVRLGALLLGALPRPDIHTSIVATAWRITGHDIHDPLVARAIAANLLPMMGADDGDDDEDGEGGVATEAEKAIGKKADKLRGDLIKRIGEMVKEDAPTGEDKGEVEKREKELGDMVDKLRDLAADRKSDEVKAFEEEFSGRLDGLKDQLEELSRQPARDPKGMGRVQRAKGDRYESDSGNLFLDMKQSAAKSNHKLGEALREHEEKFSSPEREKAWATGDLEDVDLVLPEIQEALPFLRAQARVVQLCREIRTGSPAVEFPVFTSGLDVGHHDDQGDNPPDKAESDPTFDLLVARVYTIAGLTEVPNSTLEDFPAARGWISTELGRATGIQEEIDVLSGDGVGEPLGILTNGDIPTRAVDTLGGASAGRNLITSIFRASQQVRINGHTEPTDGIMNPALWTDIALSFEDAIGFLYGPVNSHTEGGPTEQPPARVLGLPITWSSYIPTNEGDDDNESSMVVGNFQDAIVLRRSPFRVDVDTSIGFKKNRTWFRGEERMGFIVVRPVSFVKITGAVPSPVA